MSITDRDKKILAVLAVLALAAGYWFLMLAPKREEAVKAGDELAEAQERRDGAVAMASGYASARSSFASDYAEIVRLGKAIPSTVDMPSLLVQLEQASRGTGIDFARIKAGPRAGAAGAAGADGATPAQSAPGQAGQAAEGKVAGANEQAQQSEQAAEQSGGDGKGTGGGSGVPGLDGVPLEFTFRGGFFRLADLLHRMKRYVYLADGGEKVRVRGRLMVIDRLTFKVPDSAGGSEGSGSLSFDQLTAEVFATVYLTPKAEGIAAGATPQGPAEPQPAAGAGAEGGSPSGGPPTPAAARTGP